MARGQGRIHLGGIHEARNLVHRRQPPALPPADLLYAHWSRASLHVYKAVNGDLSRTSPVSLSRTAALPSTHVKRLELHPSAPPLLAGSVRSQDGVTCSSDRIVGAGCPGGSKLPAITDLAITATSATTTSIIPIQQIFSLVMA